ncbi:inositol monophosphatase family protein [Micromonospora sp. NPDC047793]|uniref:inositol monophosphatase family protein n=1 Tax=Micromonospora sp. NPDC047793 TaxID=3154342 RepID=UPI0033C88040
MQRQAPGALASKGDRDVISELDYAIERNLREFLKAETPEIGFLGEEEGSSGSTSKRWVLDPIDGASNFVRGLPLCAVSLALVHGDEAVLGVIELPFRGDEPVPPCGERLHLDRRAGRQLASEGGQQVGDGIQIRGAGIQPRVAAGHVLEAEQKPAVALDGPAEAGYDVGKPSVDPGFPAIEPRSPAVGLPTLAEHPP